MSNLLNASNSANLLNDTNETNVQNQINNNPVYSTPRQLFAHQSMPNINFLTQRTISYHGPQHRAIVPQGLFQWGIFIVVFPFKLIFSTLVELASFFSMK